MTKIFESIEDMTLEDSSDEDEDIILEDLVLAKSIKLRCHKCDKKIGR